MVPKNRMLRNAERGDTLVEVLMAIVVLALVIVGSLTLMTRGLANGQLAVEHSQVRLNVNSQIELLTFLRDQYAINPASSGGVVWKQILDNSNTTPSVYDETCNPTPAKTSPTNSTFYLERSGSGIVRQQFNASLKPATFAVAGQGLWIEATNAPSSISPPYVDFVVRACWQGAGSTGQQRTVTAIRLYSPYDPLP